jgi:hypothetical protein
LSEFVTRKHANSNEKHFGMSLLREPQEKSRLGKSFQIKLITESISKTRAAKLDNNKTSELPCITTTNMIHLNHQFSSKKRRNEKTA